MEQIDKNRKLEDLKENEDKYIKINPQTLLEKVNEIMKLRKSDNPPSKEKLREMLNDVFQDKTDFSGNT
jgi:hypothetical protein